MQKNILLCILLVFSLIFVGCTNDIEEPDTTAPSEVTSMVANYSGDSSEKLIWENPTDIDFDHVEITATPTDTNLDTITVKILDKTAETYTLQGLTNGKEYTFVIKTIDTSNNKSEGCNGVISNISVTSSGINPPDWIQGTWSGNIIYTNNSYSYNYKKSYEFSNDDFIETYNGWETSYKKYKDIPVSTENKTNMNTVTSISSATSFTTFNININYSDGSTEEFYFTKDSATTLNLSNGSYSGTLEFGKELVYEKDSTINITPPKWILGTWSNLSTDVLDISIEFTSDNMLATYNKAMTVNFKVNSSLVSYIIGVSSSSTDTSFIYTIKNIDNTTIVLIFTKNADETLTYTILRDGVLDWTIFLTK